MSIDDPVVVVCEPAHDLPYYLLQGRETFYDENRIMRRWLTWQEAWEWCEANLGVSPNDHLPERAQTANRKAYNEWKDTGQRRMF